VSLLVATVGLTVLQPAVAAPVVIQFVLSPPNVVVSPLDGQTGVLTETFEGFTPGALGATGTLAVGTFTTSGTVTVNANDDWGGSGSRYLEIAIDAGLDLTLATPARYVGFWWGAGDPGNLVTLYGSVGGTGPESQLGVFNTQSLVDLLPLAGANVTAIDGNSYASSNYRRSNAANQPFAYVNLQIDDEDLYVTRIVFSKTGSGSFELDNLTTSAAWGQAIVGATGSVIQTPQLTNVEDAPQPRSPSVECEPLELVAATPVTCTVTDGVPDVEVLWRADADAEPIAWGVVRPDADGVGTFSFVVPTSTVGRTLTVELVDWTYPFTIGTVNGPVPTRIPAGQGGEMSGLMSVLGVGLVMALVLDRRRRHRASS
jgi:hypothetical protein